jgi:cation transporter-like permease
MDPLLRRKVTRDLSSFLKETVAIAAALAVYIAVTGGGVGYAIKVFFEHFVVTTILVALVSAAALVYFRRRAKARLD